MERRIPSAGPGGKGIVRQRMERRIPSAGPGGKGIVRQCMERRISSAGPGGKGSPRSGQWRCGCVSHPHLAKAHLFEHQRVKCRGETPRPPLRCAFFDAGQGRRLETAFPCHANLASGWKPPFHALARWNKNYFNSIFSERTSSPMKRVARESKREGCSVVR